ncbi:MAG TPA: hypothetical protein PKL15_12750, partial [Saprospiraceae bacterium]|nr:hypothetical protein [Saprospiraceae bacterium]
KRQAEEELFHKQRMAEMKEESFKTKEHLLDFEKRIREMGDRVSDMKTYFLEKFMMTEAYIKEQLFSINGKFDLYKSEVRERLNDIQLTFGQEFLRVDRNILQIGEKMQQEFLRIAQENMGLENQLKSLQLEYDKGFMQTEYAIKDF